MGMMAVHRSVISWLCGIFAWLEGSTQCQRPRATALQDRDMSARTASIDIESPSAADVTWFIADRDVSLFVKTCATTGVGLARPHCTIRM